MSISFLIIFNQKRGSIVCILLLKFRFSEKAAKTHKRLVGCYQVININLEKFAITNFFIKIAKFRAKFSLSLTAYHKPKASMLIF